MGDILAPEGFLNLLPLTESRSYEEKNYGKHRPLAEVPKAFGRV
jgi:hypothetical protein